jgi:hydroxyacyl-ACP dehydratase HTD2-like protein with hotdog domain
MTAQPDIDTLQVGDTIPETRYTPDNIQLFFYNAVLWNAHRIHYDLPYATEVEGYKGLVIAGPMLGDWLAQAVDNWIGDRGMVKRVEYSNRMASFIGETLTTGGRVTAVDRDARTADFDLFVMNEAGDVITPGKVTVRFD